jgi:hypothetical protein
MWLQEGHNSERPMTRTTAAAASVAMWLLCLLSLPRFSAPQPIAPTFWGVNWCDYLPGESALFLFSFFSFPQIPSCAPRPGAQYQNFI